MTILLTSHLHYVFIICRVFFLSDFRFSSNTPGVSWVLESVLSFLNTLLWVITPANYTPKIMPLWAQCPFLFSCCLPWMHDMDEKWLIDDVDMKSNLYETISFSYKTTLIRCQLAEARSPGNWTFLLRKHTISTCCWFCIPSREISKRDNIKHTFPVWKMQTEEDRLLANSPIFEWLSLKFDV